MIFIQAPRLPVVSLQMWVRNGSAHERKGEEGISHFIEHLLFKGSRKYGVGEIARTVESIGGELNAYTSFDQTVFHITLSSQEFATGTDVLSDMMGFPVFDKSEVDREREVVIEEIRRSADSLGRRASQLMFQESFRRHPYGRPVIGYEKNVAKWPVTKIRNYYRAKYNPRNMFLVVSGGLPKDAEQIVRKAFCELPTNIPRPKKVTTVKVPKSVSVKTEKTGFQETVVQLAWPVPGLKDKNAAAVDMVAALLGHGDTSRLVRALRIEKLLVNSVSCGVFRGLEAGLLVISIGCRRDQVAVALAAIQEQLLGWLADGPDPMELNRISASVLSEKHFSEETADGLSEIYGQLEFQMKPAAEVHRYLQEIQKLSCEKVLKIGRKLFSSPGLSATAVTNTSEMELEQELLNWSKAFVVSAQARLGGRQKRGKTLTNQSQKLLVSVAKRRLAKAAESQKTHGFNFPNGSQLVVRPLSGSSVVSLRIGMRGAGLLESSEKSGLVELLRRTWFCGTSKRSELEISDVVESLGAHLSVSAGRSGLVLGADFLMGQEDLVLDLVFDSLLNPTFPVAEVEREKLVQIEGIRTQADRPSAVCGRLFTQALFGAHPYGRDPMGSESSLQSVASSDLVQFLASHRHPNNLKIAISGAAHVGDWSSRIRKATQKIQAVGSLPKIVGLGDLKTNQLVVRESSKEQTHIIHGFRGIAVSDPRRYVLMIVQSVLAGQGGRLFLELRDKASLAYSVSPMRYQGTEGGYFGTYIACAPDKAKKALMMMKEELAKLATELISEQELERAVRYLVGSSDIDLQRASTICGGILSDEMYGLGRDNVFSARENLIRVSREEVRDFSKELFSQPSVTALVGKGVEKFSI